MSSGDLASPIPDPLSLQPNGKCELETNLKEIHKVQDIGKSYLYSFSTAANQCFCLFLATLSELSSETQERLSRA